MALTSCRRQLITTRGTHAAECEIAVPSRCCLREFGEPGRQGNQDDTGHQRHSRPVGKHSRAIGRCSAYSPDDKEGDRRLGRESERELHCRESTLGELNQIRGEIEPREDDGSQPYDQGQPLGGFASQIAPQNRS